MRRRFGTSIAAVVALVGASLASMVLVAGPAAAGDANDEASFRTAFANDAVVNLTADITLATACDGTNQAAIRTTSDAVVIEGNGFSITQNCDEDAVLNQQGNGLVTLRNVTVNGATAGIDSQGPVTLEGATVQGEFVSGSAVGIRAEGDVTLTDSVVTGISGSDTTIGVYSTKSSVLLTRSEISDIADDDGEANGVFAEDDVTLIDSEISGITGSAQAYGILNAGEIVVRGSRITDVAGFDFTSAIYADALSVVMTDSLVQGVSSESNLAWAVASEDLDVEIDRSTIADVTGGDGAVGVDAEDSATVRNSTITGVDGPAVWASDVTLVYSDIVGNGSTDFDSEAAEQADGNGITVTPAAVATQIIGRSATVFGSVITNAAGVPNCDVVVLTSQGYNFADDTSCGLTATGDRQSAGLDPLLGALADNGGPTPTFLPQAASPLLEAIPAAACQTGVAAGVTVDQRGYPRPGFTACDIGSVEVQAPPVIEPTFTG